MTDLPQDPSARPEGSTSPAQSAPDVELVVVAELRLTYPVSQLMGAPVINDTGEDIGTLDDLLIQDDRLAFAILSVGGFLGIGAHQVVVAFENLLIDDDEIVLPGATKESLKRMTVYDRDRVQSEHTPLPRARPGQRDAGRPVATGGGEPIPGTIADIADGDL